MFALIGSLIAGSAQIIKKKQELKQAIVLNKIRLASSEDQYNHDWEMAELQDNDKWLRRASFIIFYYPFVAVLISRSLGTQIFNNMEIIPHWYLQTLWGINACIYGSHALKNPISSIISSVSNR